MDTVETKPPGTTKPKGEPMQTLTLPVELVEYIDRLRERTMVLAKTILPETGIRFERPSRRHVLQVALSHDDLRITGAIQAAELLKAEEENRAKFPRETDNG